MSLSIPNKPDKFDFLIFPVVTPLSNLSISWSRLWALLITLMTIGLCTLPCILYIIKNKAFMSKPMLQFVKAGVFFCFVFILCLTILSYRSDYIHDHEHFSKVPYILTFILFLSFVSLILLWTYKSYGLTEDDITNILDTFNDILGIAENTDNEYNTDADTVDEIRKNLEYLQNQLKNKKSVSVDEFKSQVLQIQKLVDSVKKNLQKQLDDKKKELEESEDVDTEALQDSVDTLKSQIEKLTKYYDSILPYLKQNKGRVFILIMFVLFLIIYGIVFIIDKIMYFRYKDWKYYSFR